MRVWCLRFGIVQSVKASDQNSNLSYTAQLLELGHKSGLDKMGVASADVLQRAREAINDRKASGLDNEMQFTFRNPERSTDPTKTLHSAKSVIVGALSYSTMPPENPAELSARVARYVWSDYYDQLRKSLQVVADQLKEDGFRAIVLADENAIVDREIAYQSGVGWFGKNSNLLIKGAGSYFVLGSVVTDAVLDVAKRTVDDGCGSCTRCLENCPTGAIIEPGVIDANKCLAWLLQKPGVFDPKFRVPLGDRIYGCDDCQEVCPPTIRFVAKSRPELPLSGSLKAWVSVEKILTSDDESLINEFGAWYIANRDPKWLRRNALIILGNIADASKDIVVELLKKYLMHDDAMLRAHAVWSAGRLGLGYLIDKSDDDELVKAELAALPSVK